MLEFTEQEIYDLLGYRYYVVRFTKDGINNKSFAMTTWAKDRERAIKKVYEFLNDVYASVHIQGVDLETP